MSKEKKIHIVKSMIKHGLLLCVGFSGYILFYG